MAPIVIDVIKEFGFANNIGYFILDNAPNNDTCVRIVLRELTNLSDTAICARRLRCLGHVLNLSAKALLYGEDFPSFNLEVQTYKENSDLLKELRLWRKRGPVGKLHNIVVYINRSPQRRQEFEATLQSLDQQDDSNHLQLIADNDTRWNSLYDMIVRALRLRERIDRYTDEHRSAVHGSQQKLTRNATPEQKEALLREDQLTPDEWLTLKEIARILEPYKELTMHSEGKSETAERGVLFEYLVALNQLTLHLKTTLSQLESNAYQLQDDADDVDDNIATGDAPDNQEINKYLHICVSNAWVSLDKYFRLLDEAPAHYAACVTQPAMKWKYFTHYWHVRRHSQGPIWLAKAEDCLDTIWEQYKPANGPIQPLPIPRKRAHSPDFFEEHIDMTSIADSGDDEDRPNTPDNELREWIKSDPIRVTNPLEFWLNELSNRPHLAKMAIDMLSIPAMSAECERVFSSAKLLITDRCGKLNPVTIEASECLRAWTIMERKEAGTWSGKAWRPCNL